MREIKFRAWDKLINKMITESNVNKIMDTIRGDFNTTYVYDSGEWYPAYEIFGIFNYFQAIREMRIDRYNEKSELRFEVMQYTGLHDKNGKEIYEGDIVKVTYRNEIDIFEVRYDEENTCFRMYYEDLKFLDFTIEETNLYEAIGNIYDNPELLEVKDE